MMFSTSKNLTKIPVVPVVTTTQVPVPLQATDARPAETWTRSVELCPALPVRNLSAPAVSLQRSTSHAAAPLALHPSS